jgi:hypothetical protein
MDRKQFLKMCAGGLCTCAAVGALSPLAAADTPAKPNDDWRLPFVKERYAKLLEILGTTVSPETLNDILRLLGRHCASTYPLIQEHRGDVDGFITEFKKRANEDIQYDREKGIVTVVGPERGDCFCPLVDRKHTPVSVCNCSLGWQQFTYEALLGKKVTVELKESVVRGGKRCVFEIRVLPLPAPAARAASVEIAESPATS